MHKLWYVLGGIALLRLTDDRKGIGKIVDGKPDGVTPCLDGKFSTNPPGPGVCSYHAGWKGTAPKKQKEETDYFPPGTQVVFTHRWGPYMVGTQATVSRGKVKYMPISREPAIPLNFGKNQTGQMLKGTVPISVIKPLPAAAPAPAPAKPKPAPQIIAPKETSPAPAAAPYIPPRDRKPPERPETGPNETAIRVYGGWKVVQLPVPPAGVYIEDITYEEGKRAHSGTSLSPDKRGEQEVIGHRQELINTWEFLAKGRSPEQLAALRLRWPSFVQKYTKLKRETLGRRSRVMSTMVTGPANFPTRSNEKKSNAYENKGKEMYAFKDRFENSVRSDREIYPERMMTEPIKSGEANALQELEEKHRKLVKDHELMVATNKAIRSKKDVPEKLKNLGYSEKSIATILGNLVSGNRFFDTYQLTNSNANIRRLNDRIIQEKRVIATREQGEKEKAFAGGQIREDHGDNRLRIYFDSIPDNELRSKLKKSGWKWSPKNQAWQRQLTPNAWSSARYILPII